ncbi:MAG: MAPEG family protein [Beijerinckiaceae bacterium]|jgi:uncharacterized MAPEG superfamily protein
MSTAYWCLLVGALLPYVNAGIAKASSPYDNRFPRALEKYQGMALRAHGAHQNSFEVFPFFAVAVLVASGGSAHVADPLLDSLALAWIVSRLAYTAAYVLDRPTARSLIWFAGMALSLAIFTMPAWHR